MPAVTQSKFNLYSQNLTTGKINFSSDTIKVALTNTAPVATNAIFSDITEIAAGNGYTAGGATVTVTPSNSSGTEKLSGTNLTITASGGSIGPFRYLVFYDATQTTPLKPLISWGDLGTAYTLNAGDALNVTFDGTNGWFQIA